MPIGCLAHQRRQAARRLAYVVEDNKGRQVGDIRKGFDRAQELAAKLAAKRGIEIDLSDVTPHTLKHTAITWAMQNGASTWDAASYSPTSIEPTEWVYGYHWQTVRKQQWRG